MCPHPLLPHARLDLGYFTSLLSLNENSEIFILGKLKREGDPFPITTPADPRLLTLLWKERTFLTGMGVSEALPGTLKLFWAVDTAVVYF